ncbi:hypothetical protein CRG98_006034 [Punica granatum]|uniref:Uncharacterized protein n=1 Tax=Punica granatum TaxID=22663 RepID=A0A2I0L0E9_PUNGR|nr:hypothetical protein CRG98_006034 [Punica granatum]
MELSPNPLSFPSGIAKLCGPEFRLVMARMRALSHCLGVSTFPWGCMTDMRERESPLAILRSEDQGPASYPDLGVRGCTLLTRFDTVTSMKHSDRLLTDRGPYND